MQILWKSFKLNFLNQKFVSDSWNRRIRFGGCKRDLWNSFLFYSELPALFCEFVPRIRFSSIYSSSRPSPLRSTFPHEDPLKDPLGVRGFLFSRPVTPFFPGTSHQKFFHVQKIILQNWLFFCFFKLFSMFYGFWNHNFKTNTLVNFTQIKYWLKNCPSLPVPANLLPKLLPAENTPPEMASRPVHVFIEKREVWILLPFVQIRFHPSLVPTANVLKISPKLMCDNFCTLLFQQKTLNLITASINF